jgi:hypothetical protein
MSRIHWVPRGPGTPKLSSMLFIKSFVVYHKNKTRDKEKNVPGYDPGTPVFFISPKNVVYY